MFLKFRLITKFFVLVSTFLTLLLTTTPAFAASNNANNGPQNPIGVFNNNPTPSTAAKNVPILVPGPPNINAKGYVLMDFNTGQIIAQKNMDVRMPPASLTKMMTLYIVSDAIKTGRIHLTDKVRISKKAASMGGSKMFLRAGSEVPVQKLIEGVIVDSGNDACVALAQYVAGSESAFTELMNEQAKLLGMKHTHYTDSTGLPHPDHYSTPHDLAILARALIKNFPEDYKWYKQKWLTWENIKQPNRNRLLWRDPYVDGIKTGHTKEAGYCLVSSGKKDGMRLISVVMGTPTDDARINDSQAMLTYGYRFFESKQLFAAGATIKQPRVWLGEQKTIPVGLMNNLFVVVPTGSEDQIKTEISLAPSLRAPIAKGQQLGTVSVSLNGKQLEKKPLIALQADPKGGFFRRVSDYISMAWNKLLG